MKKILAFDYGRKRVGMAISDELWLLATPLETQVDKSDEQIFDQVEHLMGTHQIESFVVGMPYNMNGSIGPGGEKCKEFAENLSARFSLPCELWDERLTSVEAEGIMLMGDLSRKKRKRKVDELAARIILQSYLAYRKQQSEES
ncbi:Holliday junction resolvase RuvX [Planctomycetota bacterium]